MPFSLRALPLDEKDARLGINECVKVGSLSAFPVIEEREGALTAHVRFTVLFLAGGTFKATGLELAQGVVVSDKAPSAAQAAVLATVPYTKLVKPAAAAAAAGGMAE